MSVEALSLDGGSCCLASSLAACDPPIAFYALEWARVGSDRVNRLMGRQRPR
jgi:hypothetical protein